MGPPDRLGQQLRVRALAWLAALILPLFPDGRPPSRRWRWLAWAIGVIVVATTIAGAVLPADAADPIQNPLAVEGSIEAVADAVANAGVTALFLAILVSAGSLLLRFRRARGLERQQLKWLAYGRASLAAYVALDCMRSTGSSTAPSSTGCSAPSWGWPMPAPSWSTVSCSAG